MTNTGSKGKLSNYLIPILAIIGIIVSAELTYVYFNANFVAGAVPSFCAINETLDCDAVAKTNFSTFLGVPLSVYGLFFYILVLKISLLPFVNLHFMREFKNPKSYIFSVASIAIIVSAILAIISSTMIHKICILCYLTYLINLFILFLSKSGISFMTHYTNTLKDSINILSKPFWLTAVIAFSIIAASGLYYFNASKVFIPQKPVYVNKPATGNTQNSGNILGAKNPKLIIHEYTDFECPYCSVSNLMFHRLVSEVPEVQVVHHDFPLGSCNAKVNNTSHKNSCLAALYARAAAKQGKRWAMIDSLFENQQDLSEEKILKQAKKLNLNIEKLKKDAHDPLAMKQLKEDVNKAMDSGVTATPTFFLGIKKHEGLMPYPELKATVLEHIR